MQPVRGHTDCTVLYIKPVRRQWSRDWIRSVLWLHVMAMVTRGEGQLVLSSGRTNEQWGCTIMQCFLGGTFVTRKQTEPSGLRPVHWHRPLFLQNAQIHSSDCCRVCLLLMWTFTIWTTIYTCVSKTETLQEQISFSNQLATKNT